MKTSNVVLGIVAIVGGILGSFQLDIFKLDSRNSSHCDRDHSSCEEVKYAVWITGNQWVSDRNHSHFGRPHNSYFPAYT
jgi:hypothetical protein